MARHDDRRMGGPRYRGDRDYDQERRDMRYAYGRYSGGPSADDRDYDFGDPGYDPDHAYRSRRYRGYDDAVERPWREQPYADRPYPGENGDRGRGARGRGLNRPWDRAEAGAGRACERGPSTSSAPWLFAILRRSPPSSTWGGDGATQTSRC